MRSFCFGGQMAYLKVVSDKNCTLHLLNICFRIYGSIDTEIKRTAMYN